MLRILRAKVLSVGHVVEFTLSDRTKIERDFSNMSGPVIDPIWRDRKKFEKLKVVQGVPTWPGNVDFCPDAIIWGGFPSKRGKPLVRAKIRKNGRLSRLGQREFTLDERRRYVWYLRYGAEWSLEAIGKKVGKTTQTIRSDLSKVESSIYYVRRHPPSIIPGWWRRLRIAGALRRDEYDGNYLQAIQIPSRN